MCSLYLGDQIISGQATLVGESRNIGQIIPSVIPLTDAGLHLLDGSLIQGGGIYSAFVTHIAGLVSTYPNLFVSESDWQTAVTTYGVCGKFVYDSTNNTVRLPKVTGILEGTTDVNALGDLVEAGLPNITGEFGAIYSAETTKSGCFSDTSWPSKGSGWQGSGSALGYHNINFKASKSSSIYGNSTTVQPQTIKAFYYIVIATTTKTNVEVDIDEIATDLNGKADVDLTNVNDSGTSIGAGWAMPSNTYENLTLGASGSTYTAPANGYFFLSKSSTASGQNIIFTKLVNTAVVYRVKYSPPSSQGCELMIPTYKGENIQVDYTAAGSTNYFRFIYAQGSESEAS